MADLPFRRRVILRNPEPGRIEASVEDHIHHFEVTLAHDGSLVRQVEGRAVRAPWSLCPGASDQLAELVGVPVGPSARVPDPSQHCTHLLDLAIAAVRFAGTPVPERRVELTAAGWDDPPMDCEAVRDDGLTLHWRATAREIIEPEPFSGVALGAGFTTFVGGLDDDIAELALLLRRATWLGASRSIDLDDYEVLRESGLPVGACFSSQPGRIDEARRNRGSSLVELRFDRAADTT